VWWPGVGHPDTRANTRLWKYPIYLDRFNQALYAYRSTNPTITTHTNEILAYEIHAPRDVRL
jgi:hypothetical protein